MAATSVYLHFDDIDSLTLAVVNHLFDELIRRQDQITETDPRQRVLAGALVYCEFGLASPGHYQLMFARPLPLPGYTPEHFPGWKSFQQLIGRVAACIGADPQDSAGVLHRPADLAADARHRQPAHLPVQVSLAAAGGDGGHRGRPPARPGSIIDPERAGFPAPAPAPRRP